MFVRSMAFAVSATAILACGSSSSSSGGAAQGANSVDGTFGGQSLTAQDAIAEIQTQPMAGATVTSADILIANVGSLCGLAQRHASSPGVSLLDLNLGGPGTQITPGTYEVNGQGSSAMFAAAYFGSEDGHCKASLSEVGMSGTITISDASASSVSGSFDVMFASTSSTGVTSSTADHVTGHFIASVCSVPATDGGTARACGGS
jgi:hypothetical protein